MATAPAKTLPAAVPFGATCVVVDVRTALEHKEVSLKQPHHHVPLHELDAAKFLREQNISNERPVYVLCRSGKRATQAAEAFMAAGHANVHVIEGGIIACEAAGIPLRKGQVISLERQVRIAAGAAALAGTALGAFLSPAFYVVPAAVGAGLVYAGVTDNCALAFLLARAPWNKGLAKEGATACAAATTACQASAAPTVKMPEGTAFYAPANGGAAQPAAQAPSCGIKTGTGGGCS